MTRRLVFTRRAEAQLDVIEAYIEQRAEDPVAADYVDRIVTRCEAILDVPEGGTPRGDLGRGLRSVAFERRVTIVYRVQKDVVVIAGVFYGGQDLSRHFRGRAR